jgi:integrase
MREHIRLYRAELVRRQCSERYVAHVVKILERVAAETKARDISDVTGAKIGEALAALWPDAPRSQNLARIVLRGWFNWLCDTAQWIGNPAEAVRPAREVRKRERRSSNPEELYALLSSEAIPIYRRVVYAVAATTGLRRGELRAAAPADLDRAEGVLARKAGHAKNRRTKFAHLVPGVRALIERWIMRERGWDRVARRRRLFRVPGCRTFYADLERAGIAPAGARGWLDFHALRVTCGTTLDRAGASERIAQGVLDHSDPRLTANVYQKRREDEEAEALDRAFAFLGFLAEEK